jgi:hypothetical protein
MRALSMGAVLGKLDWVLTSIMPLPFSTGLHLTIIASRRNKVRGNAVNCTGQLGSSGPWVGSSSLISKKTCSSCLQAPR